MADQRHEVPSTAHLNESEGARRRRARDRDHGGGRPGAAADGAAILKRHGAAGHRRARCRMEKAGLEGPVRRRVTVFPRAGRISCITEAESAPRGGRTSGRIPAKPGIPGFFVSARTAWTSVKRGARRSRPLSSAGMRRRVKLELQAEITRQSAAVARPRPSCCSKPSTRAPKWKRSGARSRG